MRGYIAITTTIILSLLMLVLAVTLGRITLSTRFDTVDFTNKRSSYFVARSCLEYARYKLSLDSGYLGNETQEISSYQCSVLDVEVSGQNQIIKSSATVDNSTTNLRLTILASDLSTVTLEEIVKF
jgi:hypothetical protein